MAIGIIVGMEIIFCLPIGLSNDVNMSCGVNSSHDEMNGVKYV